MLRKAKIVTPGALHHIICRGIERRDIFTDNAELKTANEVKEATECEGTWNE